MKRLNLAGECAFPALVASVLAVVLPTAYSLFFANAAYAGVQDEAVSNVAQAQYQSYLSEVALGMAIVALTEVFLFFLVVFGISLGWRLWRRRRLTRAQRWGGHLAGGGLVALGYFGFVAERHPGLFLSTLSHVDASYVLLGLARWVTPAIGVLAVTGYGYVLWRGPNRARALVVAVAVLLGGIGYGRWLLRRRYVHVPYRATKAELDAAKAQHAKPTPRKKQNGKPDVLWIGVDSLRPDKIDARTTPNIARLLAESVYFPNTVVTVPRTGPSWVATMTGLGPLTNGVETMFPDERAGRLSTIALPSHLTAKGYRTGAFTDYAGEFFGRVNLGFQHKSIPEVELREISGQLLIGSAPLVLGHLGLLYSLGPAERSVIGDPLTTLLRGLTSFTQPSVLAHDLDAWLDIDPTTPYFALLFYSQPHFPYASNSPYYRTHHVSGSDGAIAFGRDVTNESAIRSSEDVRQLDGLYRGALEETDVAVGRLLGRLEAEGKLDDTIVILTADHGEGLYDCATCVGHGDNLRSMVTLRTPLAFRLPGKRFPQAKPKQVDAWVSQLDIYPTILSLLGEAPVVIHEGQSLLDASGHPKAFPRPRVHFLETGEWLWTTQAVPKDRLSYPPITGMATLEHGRIVIDAKYLPAIRAAKHRAALQWPFKLAYEPSRGGVGWHLYNVEADPFEEHDVKETERVAFESLQNAFKTDLLRHSYLMTVRDVIVSRPPPPAEE